VLRWLVLDGLAGSMAPPLDPEAAETAVPVENDDWMVRLRIQVRLSIGDGLRWHSPVNVCRVRAEGSRV
jgi:hypothetical protein